MKYIITENQLRVLIEQEKDWNFGIVNKNMSALGLNPKNPNDIKKYNTMINKPVDPHELATVIQIISIFTPYSFLITAAVGAVDAAIYYSDGDTEQAAATFILSVLPFVVSELSQVPAIRNLGRKGLSELGKKIIGNSKNMSVVEKEAVSEMAKKSDLIKKTMDKYIKKIATSKYNKTKDVVMKKLLYYITKLGIYTTPEVLTQLKKLIVIGTPSLLAKK
jgi:hypothetical protein